MAGGRISRRSLLVGGASAAVAAGGVGGWLATRGPDLPELPDVATGERVDGSFESEARGGAETGWAVAYPPESPTDAPLPVWLVLHGASFDHAAAFDRLGLDRYLALALRDGVRPFAVAAADGGPTYWRPQPDGTDSSRMLTEEFLPMLAERGLRTDRLALGGWSMGGYGALRLACLRGVPVRAVAVMSPALPGEDVAADRLAGLPLRVDCGRQDGFYPAVRELVAAVDPPPASSFGDGGHDMGYWRSVVPEQAAFVGGRLG